MPRRRVIVNRFDTLAGSGGGSGPACGRQASRNGERSMPRRNIIELFYGTALAQRFEALRGELFAEQLRPSEQPWLMLLPTQRRAHMLREQFYMSLTSGESPNAAPAGGKSSATCEPLVFSMHELINRLSRFAPHRRRILNRAGQEILIASLSRRLTAQLDYIRPTAQGEPYPGTVRYLARLFSALAEGEHTSASLERLLLARDADDTPRTRDILTIFAQYESALKRHGWADAAMWESQVVAALTPQILRTAFPALKTLIVDGFDVYTPSLLALLRTFGEMCERVEILLAFDPQPEARREPFARARAQVFPHLAEAFTLLKALAGRSARLETQPAGASASAHDALERHLFASRRPLKHKIPAKDFVTIFAAHDRRDEVQRIAHWIKQTAVEAATEEKRAGRPSPTGGLNRIGVTFAQLDLYAPLVREIFADFGIPYHVSTGISLAQSPVVRATFEVLNLVRTNYHRTALLRLVNSPYVRLSLPGPEGTPPAQHALSAELLNTLSIRLFIIDGKENWTERLERELRRIDLRCNALEQGYAEHEEEITGEQNVEALRAEQAHIAASLKGLATLFNILDPLESPSTLSDFRNRLLTVLEALGFSSLTISREMGFIPLETLRFEIESYRLFLRTLDEMVSLEPLVGTSEVTLDEFERLLRWAVENVSLQLPGEDPWGVQVMGKLEPRGMRFDYLIVGGLVEGEFPAQPQPALLLTPQQLAAVGLRHPRLALSEERYLFYLYLAETARRVILAYPQMEGEEVLLRSSFIEEVESLANAERLAPPDAEKIYSTRAAQRALGCALAARPHDRNSSRDAATLCSFASCLSRGEAEMLLRDASRRVNAVLLREETTDLSEYDGIMKDPTLKEEISRLMDERVFSVSQLEEYGRCPFLFFCRRLLGIEPLEELEEEMTPLERGSLLHEILFRFYTARRASGATPFRTPEELDSARRELLAIAQERLSRYAFGGILWEIERERFLGGSGPLGRTGILQRFLELDHDEFSTKGEFFEPRFFEASFGRVPEDSAPPDSLSHGDPFVLERDGVRVRLRGKIDRIDLLGNAFIVLDYKSGKTTRPLNDLDKGLALQLPIYLLAARRLLQRHLGATLDIAAALYFILHDDAHCEKKPFLFDEHYRRTAIPKGKRAGKCSSPEELQSYLDKACDIAIHYVSAMKSGRFHPTVRDYYSTCDSCDYKYVCRINYAKMQLLKDGGQYW
jgi:ATP-dependent helicase/nuclease subunit B